MATIQENSIAQSVITLQSLTSTVPQASAAAVALAPEPEIARPATVSLAAPSYAIFASRARIPSELEEGAGPGPRCFEIDSARNMRMARLTTGRAPAIPLKLLKDSSLFCREVGDVQKRNHLFRRDRNIFPCRDARRDEARTYTQQ